MSRPRGALVVALAILLAGCAPPPDRAPHTLPAHGEPVPRGWLAGAGTAVRLDPARSAISIRAYRAGRLAHLGHNHVIEVTGLRGTLKRLADGGGVAELSFRADQMRVDDPVARARAGEAFTRQPDQAAVDGTRRNMLGPQLLDAGRWPQIAILARVADLDAAQPLADIHLSLRGNGRRYRVPVTVSRAGDAVTVAGSLLLPQSELGITPFSVLGGALQVRDTLEVDFRIVGRNSGASL